MSERLQAVMAKAYATVPQERLIDAHELARLLSLKDDVRLIHRRARAKGWPMYYVGARLPRFRYSEVLALLECENQPQHRTQGKERSA